MEKSVNFDGIVVTRVYSSQYQKAGTITAELKQSVSTTTKYAGALGADDNLFSTSDFSELESPEYTNSETRVYWMNVPAGSTVQDVQLRLQNATNAKLVKVLSNRPIISDSQKYAIEKGLTSTDAIANSQVVKDSEGNLIRRNGDLCFKKIVFSLHGGEDENLIHENAYELSTSLMG